MKKCPFCAEEIQDEAVKCKHCGEFLAKKKPSAPRGNYRGCLIGCLIMLLVALGIIGAEWYLFKYKLLPAIRTYYSNQNLRFSEDLPEGVESPFKAFGGFFDSEFPSFNLRSLAEDIKKLLEKFKQMFESDSCGSAYNL